MIRRKRHYLPPPHEIVFLAMTMKEYKELKRDYPDAKVTLNLSKPEQLNLLGADHAAKSTSN